MPEGDTVLRTARRLDQALRGRPLFAAELRWGDLGAVDLTGARTVEVASRGKHLLHRLDDGRTVHTHLRMEGFWRVVATGDAARARQQRSRDVRAVLVTDDWTCLGLRLGMLDLVPPTQEHRLVGHLGPDVLGEDWDLDRAVATRARAGGGPVGGAIVGETFDGGAIDRGAIAGSSSDGGASDGGAFDVAEIGGALLDQRHLAGIGTIYASESLFCERVSPWTPVAELGRSRLTAVVERARRQLLAGARRPSPCTTGIPRSGQALYVHGRSGRSCRRCGGTVRVAPIGRPPRERVLFYCPSCQGGLAPGDDGGPIAPLGAARRPNPLRAKGILNDRSSHG